MGEDRPADVLRSLPHARTHRRSTKRPPRQRVEMPPPLQTPPLMDMPAMARTPPPSGGASFLNGHRTPPRPGSYRPRDAGGAPAGFQPPQEAPDSGTPLLATTVEAAAELAEICLLLSARAIRATLARLPRP